MSDDNKKKKGAVHLSDADFQETVDNSEIPVFVDFYADWCGPCQMAAPVVEKLADEYDGKVLVAKVDVDNNPKTAQAFGVMSIPTIIAFKKNDEDKMVPVGKQPGFPGEQGFRQILDSLVDGE